MTENKLWKIIEEQFISYYGGCGYKISNGECGFWLWHSKEESQKVCDKLNSILDEKEQLESKNKILLEHCDDLQERNDRQAKQLDNIYNLIEKQDWETLQGLIEEFKECEEQLKVEMECYE